MSRSWPAEGIRAQTEPLGAIVAVSALALAIGLYGVVLTDALDTGSDRAVEQATINLVWDDLEQNGAYPVDVDPSVAIAETSLPDGYNVVVNVSRLNEDGQRETIAEARFAADGESAVEDPPDNAGIATRSVAVREAPGIVRMATLRVEVWEP